MSCVTPTLITQIADEYEALCARCGCSCPDLLPTTQEELMADPDAGYVSIVYDRIKEQVGVCFLDAPELDPGSPPACLTDAYLAAVIVYLQAMPCKRVCRIEVGKSGDHSRYYYYYWFDGGAMFQPGGYRITYVGNDCPTLSWYDPPNIHYACALRYSGTLGVPIGDVTPNILCSPCTRIGDEITVHRETPFGTDAVYLQSGDAATESNSLFVAARQACFAGQIGAERGIILAAPSRIGVLIEIDRCTFWPAQSTLFTQYGGVQFELSPCPLECVQSAPAAPYYVHGDPTAQIAFTDPTQCSSDYRFLYKRLPEGQTCANPVWCQTNELTSFIADFDRVIPNDNTGTFPFPVPDDGYYCGLMKSLYATSPVTNVETVDDVTTITEEQESTTVLDGNQFCFTVETCDPSPVISPSFLSYGILDQMIQWTAADDCWDYFQVLLRELPPSEDCTTLDNWCDINELTVENADQILIATATELRVALESGFWCARVNAHHGSDVAEGDQWCFEVECDQLLPEVELILPVDGDWRTTGAPTGRWMEFRIRRASEFTIYVNCTDCTAVIETDQAVPGGYSDVWTHRRQYVRTWPNTWPLLNFYRCSWYVSAKNDCGTIVNSETWDFMYGTTPSFCEDILLDAWTVRDGGPARDLSQFTFAGSGHATWELRETSWGSLVASGLIDQTTNRLIGLVTPFVPPIHSYTGYMELWILCP